MNAPLAVASADACTNIINTINGLGMAVLNTQHLVGREPRGAAVFSENTSPYKYFGHVQ
jgi:hypothetical protein